MTLSRWRSSVSLTLLVILPVYLFADDSGARAILRSSGGVLVNKSTVPQSVALFPQDEIETQANATARIDYTGSSADISPESVIKVETGEIVLEHGSVIVTTFKQFRVRSGCVLATPVVAEKTVYTVTNTNSRVRVQADTNDVNLDSRSDLKRANRPESSGHEIVHQSEEKSRDEHCGAGNIRTSPVETAGPILNSPWVVGTASAVIVGGVVCVLVCLDKNPVSPSSFNQ